MDRASYEPPVGHHTTQAEGTAAPAAGASASGGRPAFGRHDAMLGGHDTALGGHDSAPRWHDAALRWRGVALRWLEVIVGGIGVAVGWSQRMFGIARQTLARNRWARAVYRWMRRPAHARTDRPPLTGPRVAERLAEAFAPVIVISATALFVALSTAASPVAGIGWAALAVLFGVVIPEARNWLGTWRDEHEGDTGVRMHRRRPVTFGLAPMVLGLALMVVLGAPGGVVALMVAMLGLLHAVAAVRRRWHWRPSVHTAVAAACATALVAVFGAALLVAYLVPVAAGWARVVQGERSSAEAVVGAAFGVAVTAPAYLLIG